MWRNHRRFIHSEHTSTHKNMHNAFCPVNPVHDMDTYIFKVSSFTNQAKYE